MCVCVCVYMTWVNAHGNGKRTLDPLKLKLPDSCELPCRLWELNPSPLKEQLVLLVPFLQSQVNFL